MLDATNKVTTNVTLATRYNYTIVAKKLIFGYSFDAVVVSIVNTRSTIVVVPPSRVVPSSVPLNGTYVISCSDNKN